MAKTRSGFRYRIQRSTNVSTNLFTSHLSPNGRVVIGGGCALKIKFYRWRPVQVRNYMLVQLGEVISLERTSMKSFFTHKLIPGAHETTRTRGFTAFVSPIGFAHTSDERPSYVMLRGGDVVENGGAKTTLVSNSKKIKHLTNVVPRQIGPYLMVHKFRIRVGHKGAGGAIDTNVTLENPSGLVVVGTVAIHVIKFTKPYSSDLFEVDTHEIKRNLRSGKERSGIIANCFAMRELNYSQRVDIVFKLGGPGVGIGIFIPRRVSKPGRQHSPSVAGISSKALQPLQAPDAQLKVHRQNTTLTKNTRVAPRAMFVSAGVMLMGFTTK